MTLPVSNLKLRTVVNPPYSTKNSELTWNELDTDLIILGDNIAALQQPGASGFSPYNNGTTYSNVKPDFVSYNNNIWEYVNAVPQAGITPGSDPTVWQLASLGQFSHEQNTDQYLDFGGANQVSATDLKNLLDNPSGDSLHQGTNTLTSDLIFDLVSSFVLKIKNGPIVVNSTSPIQNETDSGQFIRVGTSSLDVTANSSINISSQQDVITDAVQTVTARQINGDSYSASTVGPDSLFSTSNGAASYYFDTNTNDYTAVLVNQGSASIIFGNLATGNGKKIVIDGTNISFVGNSDVVKFQISESQITNEVKLVLSAPIQMNGQVTYWKGSGNSIGDVRERWGADPDGQEGIITETFNGTGWDFRNSR